MADKIDYAFDQSVSIKNMSQWGEKCKKLLKNAKKKNIRLDLRNLQEADLAFLQVIASMYKECLANDKALHLIGPLDPILQDSWEEMDLLRMGKDVPILFEQIQGGIQIECQ